MPSTSATGAGGWSDVLDLVGARCPPFDRSDKAEAKRVVEAPAPDTKDAAGRLAVSRAARRKHTDDLENAVERKNQVIARMDDEHERCRGNEPAAAKRPPTS